MRLIHLSLAKRFQHIDKTIEYEHDYGHLDPLIPNSVVFILLLILEIPSLICHIFVIIYILVKKSLRSAPNNYVMIIMLFYSFMTVLLDIPWQMDYYRRSIVPVRSIVFCRIWWFIDLCFICTDQMLMAWASFERHILIFHSHSLDKSGKRFLSIICHRLLLLLI